MCHEAPSLSVASADHANAASVFRSLLYPLGAPAMENLNLRAFLQGAGVGLVVMAIAVAQGALFYKLLMWLWLSQ